MDTERVPFRAFPAEAVEGSLVARFESCAERYAARLAIHDDTGDWTYAEVNSAANSIAHELIAVMTPGRPVVVLFEDSAWYLIAILAVLKAGGFYVPFDPSQPVNRLRTLFSESDAAVLLCDSRLDALAAKIAPVESTLRVQCVRVNGGRSNPAKAALPEDPAYVLYTSGSMGEPKGVLQSHRNVLFDIRRLTNDLQVTADDRFAMLYLPWFSASIGPSFGALLNGASVHIYPLPGCGLAGLEGWLVRQRITICDMSLAVFRQLTGDGASAAGFRSMRILGLGGEPVTRLDFDRFRRFFPRGAILQNGYGTTETRTISQFLLTHETEFAGNIVPVGVPVDGKTVVVLTEEGRDASVGQAGEIVVRSRYLSPGYWRRPDLTGAAFQGGEAPAERSYRTGDAGMWIGDGHLLHMGRLDSQLKIRGHRVEPAEVESAVLRFDACREAVVTAETGADGEAQLLCYFVSRGDRPTVSAIRKYLAGELPAYMIPGRFLFLDSLPRLANGKVDLRNLPRGAASRPFVAEAFAAPMDPLDRTIATLAEEVLGVEGPGLDDNLLDLGCDSLKATEFLRRLEQKLARAIPVDVFFGRPTIAGLVEAIREGGHVVPTECVIPIRPGGSRPPLFCMPGLDGEAENWFRLAQLLGPEQPVYSLQAQGLDGRREPHRTLTEMAAHYAAAIQRVRPEQPAYLFGYSIGGLLAQECARQLARLGRSVGPLILVDTLDLGDYRRFWQFLRKVNARLGRYRRGRVANVGPGGPMPSQDSVRAAIQRAIRNHRPQPYDGSGIYFQPSESGFLFPQTRHAPWRGLILGGLEVRTVPGDHLTMVESPQVEDLVSQLKEALDRHEAGIRYSV